MNTTSELSTRDEHLSKIAKIISTEMATALASKSPEAHSLALLFEYVLRFPTKLKGYSDQGQHRD